MKGAKRWTTTAGATCALCRASYPESTKGVLVDLSTPVELTTVVKFICLDCAGPIATAIVGEEVAKRTASRGQR